MSTYALTTPDLSTQLQEDLTQLGGAALLHALRCATEAYKQAVTDASQSDDHAVAHTWQRAELCAREAYDRSWEKLHCGAWKSIASAWREAFGVAGVLLALCLEHKRDLLECMRTLDMCLMMAGPHAWRHTYTLIDRIESTRQSALVSTLHTASVAPSESYGAPERPAKKPRASKDDDDSDTVTQHKRSIKFPIPRLHAPSLAEFREHVLLQDEPVIITGAMDDWPALGRRDPARAWRDIEYFRRVAGWRTVPIEIGSSYLEDDWKQELMTINEFIDRYITRQQAVVAADNNSTAHTIGYLAQHHLFEQIQVLGRDIMTPDYCVLRRPEHDQNDDQDDEDIAVNAWFGPRGTVSPLHYDPKDNLLCQVVGAKYLRLFAPRESAKLYPVAGLLANTSQVRVEDPDDSAFPQFRHAAYVECVLREGEMLYIPPRYWHFVKSLTTSFSVSFWWA